jgi:hypothetical protein
MRKCDNEETNGGGTVATKEDRMSAHRPIALALCLIAALAGSRPAHAAFDAVLCLKNTGSGTPKFRIGKPPAPAACKSTEIQIAHFDGTTFQFTGVNVQIVSGSGKTDGAANGRGNLIVGYDEPGVCEGAEPSENICRTTADCPAGQTCTATGAKTGSHNIVVGGAHSYSSYGGLVVGKGSTISGPYSSVSGGEFNTASGIASSVSGGGRLTQPAGNGWAAGSIEPNTVVGNFESP